MSEYDLSLFDSSDLRKTVDGIYKSHTGIRTPSKFPFAVLCGGQPGAGKTTIHDIFCKHIPNVILINGDHYRQLHPNFLALRDKYGDESVKHTQTFSNAVTESLIDRLSADRYNLIIEGTLRNPSVSLGTCHMLKSRGYLVELSVMAVDRAESWQGTLDRYAAMKEKGMTPRSTSKESHDEVADKLPGNLSMIYGTKMFDRITLYTREQECVYDSKKTPHINPRRLLDGIINASLRMREANAEPPTVKERLAVAKSRNKETATGERTKGKDTPTR
jgi:UDP-N-acetylglucosamine kinase